MLLEERQLRDQENDRRDAEREAAHQLQIRQMQEQMEAMRRCSRTGASWPSKADGGTVVEVVRFGRYRGLPNNV